MRTTRTIWLRRTVQATAKMLSLRLVFTHVLISGGKVQGAYPRLEEANYRPYSLPLARSVV